MHTCIEQLLPDYHRRYQNHMLRDSEKSCLAKLKLISVSNSSSTALGSSLDNTSKVTAAAVEPDHRKKCQYCGDQHVPGRQFCLAAGQHCETCDRVDHMTKVCRSSKTHSVTHEKATFSMKLNIKKRYPSKKK